MTAPIDRRGALALGGSAILAGAMPPADATRIGRAGGVTVFDPRSPEARTLAGEAEGHRLVALSGDPVRMWRALAQHRGPVRGLTRWSDYLVLRGLAEERGLRLKREARIETAAGAAIFDWRME